MVKVTKEEVLKIAKMSKIEILDSEIDTLIEQLQDVLSYAECVREIASDVEEPSNKNINVMREGVVKRTDSKKILNQAPGSKEDYFVVPTVLDKD